MKIILTAAFLAVMAQHKNPQIRGRSKGTDTTTPPQAAPLAGMPLVPPSDIEAIESDGIEGKASRCVYIHSLLPKTQSLNHNAYARDSRHNKDFIPDLVSTLSTAWQYS
jgi:hypothetical protein